MNERKKMNFLKRNYNRDGENKMQITRNFMLTQLTELRLKTKNIRVDGSE